MSSLISRGEAQEGNLNYSGPRMNDEGNITLTDRLARMVPFVFHPLFMPLYGLVILLSAPTFLKYLPPAAKRVLLLVAPGE